MTTIEDMKSTQDARILASTHPGRQVYVPALVLEPDVDPTLRRHVIHAMAAADRGAGVTFYVLHHEQTLRVTIERVP